MTKGGFIGFIVDIIAAEEAGDATYRALFDEVPGMCDGRVLCVIIANDCFASAVGSSGGHGGAILKRGRHRFFAPHMFASSKGRD